MKRPTGARQSPPSGLGGRDAGPVWRVSILGVADEEAPVHGAGRQDMNLLPGESFVAEAVDVGAERVVASAPGAATATATAPAPSAPSPIVFRSADRHGARSAAMATAVWFGAGVSQTAPVTGKVTEPFDGQIRSKPRSWCVGPVRRLGAGVLTGVGRHRVW